jgi:hypothetical protein
MKSSQPIAEHKKLQSQINQVGYKLNQILVDRVNKYTTFLKKYNIPLPRKPTNFEERLRMYMVALGGVPMWK